jgi:predicted DNA-binding transcriptional regulator YafY
MLQARRDWSGPELASRLDVSTRTIRTDIDRLRSLGYPVEATPGVGGGYRLGHGTTMPPLLLDDEEAVAVAVGLRTTAGAGVAGIEEASVRALVKLEQMLPSRLRHRVDAMRAATVSVPGTGPTVDPAVLSVIAGAIRASERLRFDYVDHDGRQTIRISEPERLVVWGRRWYLLAWDVDRDDWRTFRVDRIEPKTPTGPRFRPRTLTNDDAARHVQRSAGTATWRYRARLRIHAPAEHVRALLPLAVDVSADGPDRCIIEAGSDSPHHLALYVGLLDSDFEIVEPPDLAEAFKHLAERYQRAARSPLPED